MLLSSLCGGRALVVLNRVTPLRVRDAANPLFASITTLFAPAVSNTAWHSVIQRQYSVAAPMLKPNHTASRSYQQSAPRPPPKPKQFRNLGISPVSLDYLAKQGIKLPTQIQEISIPHILRGKDAAFASHTGSGKTLAYLLPIMELLQRRKEGVVEGDRPKTPQPRVLVLVPTRELSLQIMKVASELGRYHKIRSVSINADDGGIIKVPYGVDVLVATPNRLIQLLQKQSLSLDKVGNLVIDEADSMFDKSFSPLVEQILAQLKRDENRRLQTVVVSATFTQLLVESLQSKFPCGSSLVSVLLDMTQTMARLVSPTTHKSLPNLEQRFVTVGQKDKLELLVEVITQFKEPGPTMVFCNSVPSCRATDHYLNEHGLPSVSFHGLIPKKTRGQNFELFKSGKKKILVSTDIGSRGLDLPHIAHVVLFDFPLNVIDYMHRVGRTARADNKGVVTSLLKKRDLVLALAIQNCIKTGRGLETASPHKADYQAQSTPKLKNSQKHKERSKAKAGIAFKQVGNARRLRVKPSKTQDKAFTKVIKIHQPKKTKAILKKKELIKEKMFKRGRENDKKRRKSEQAAQA